MLEYLMDAVMRLLGVRVFTLAAKELLDGLDQADARANTPERRALIQNLASGMLGATPPTGPKAGNGVPSLPPPAGSPPPAGEGRPSPAPLPTPPAAAPSPPAARRRGRPRKSLPPPTSAGGPAVHDSQP
jgi:hypothetical protein